MVGGGKRLDVDLQQPPAAQERHLGAAQTRELLVDIGPAQVAGYTATSRAAGGQRLRWLLAGNFYFVAVEFSVTTARLTMVDDLVEQGVTGAESLRHGVLNIDNYLSACQLGITICSVGLGIVAEPVVKEWLVGLFGGGQFLGIAATTVAFVLAYGLVSMFHVVLGELAPKSLAIARTRQTGLVLLPPMRVFYLATRPVVDLFNWMGNAVLRPFGIPPASEAEGEVYSEPELQSIIGQSRARGELGSEEEAFAHRAFTFGDRRAREVMVPRSEVAMAVADRPLREVVHHAAVSGHRRLPLCEREGDLDSALGVVNLTDLARALAEDAQYPVRELARPLHRTSEMTLLDDVLEELRSERHQLALVVDEHDTALGVLTLENILEGIVGDIRDEFDPDQDEPIEDLDGAFRVGGRADVHAVARAAGFSPGDHREATIGGFVIERLGRVPRQGETLEIDGARLRVSEVEGPHVTELIIDRPEVSEKDETSRP